MLWRKRNVGDEFGEYIKEFGFECYGGSGYDFVVIFEKLMVNEEVVFLFEFDFVFVEGL